MCRPAGARPSAEVSAFECPLNCGRSCGLGKGEVEDGRSENACSTPREIHTLSSPSLDCGAESLSGAVTGVTACTSPRVGPAFDDGAPIPLRHAASGGDGISPPLEWATPPPGRQSFVLIMEDPDAPVPTAWVRWIIFNIPASASGLEEGVETSAQLPDSSSQGINTNGEIGYGGSCPPLGDGPHRYIFRLLALDTILDPEFSPVTRGVLNKTVAGHVIGQATLVGTYELK